MRICIVRPLPLALEGLDVSRLAFGHTYDINAPLCDLLIVSGYAIPAPEEAGRPLTERSSNAIKALADATVPNGADLTRKVTAAAKLDRQRREASGLRRKTRAQLARTRRVDRLTEGPARSSRRKKAKGR